MRNELNWKSKQAEEYNWSFSSNKFPIYFIQENDHFLLTQEKEVLNSKNISIVP